MGEEIINYGRELSGRSTFNRATLSGWWDKYAATNPNVVKAVEATYQHIEDGRILDVAEMKQTMAELSAADIEKLPPAQQINHVIQRILRNMAMGDGVGSPQNRAQAETLLKLAQAARQMSNMPPDIIDMMPRFVTACNRHRLTPIRILTKLVQLLEVAAVKEDVPEMGEAEEDS